MNQPGYSRTDYRVFSYLEIVFIVVLASVPLFTSFPYRVNIFLSWEGAYRMSEGQIPYKDFGMPLGYMYWVVPAMFFKIFGAQMITLIKAQVFINIISGLAFRSILRSLSVPAGARLLSVLMYCLSYSFFNFWPWYNHTVIVYEIVALAFLFRYILPAGGRKHRGWLALSALFVCFSFLTKQDGGGLAVMLSLALLGYNCFYEKQWTPLILFGGMLAISGFLLIYPFTRFNFSYWFNYGQPPHTARVSSFDILNEFFYNSQWIKFYLLLVLLLCMARFKTFSSFLANKRDILFLLLTLGILAEAAILQVTSYTPPDNNIFFHSFVFAFLITSLTRLLTIDFNRLWPLMICGAGMLLWWSGTYWKYFQRVMDRVAPPEMVKTDSKENIVNRNTYVIATEPPEIPLSEWTFTGLKAFDRIYMPKPTVEGIHRLLNTELVKSQKPLNVLNMTELTPLAVEIPYSLEQGPDRPLWYHLGVSMFNRDAARFEERIVKKQYDLVLFEYMPGLNNFYPFRVRDSLRVHYRRSDAFPAPRRGDRRSVIEVYTKP